LFKLLSKKLSFLFLLKESFGSLFELFLYLFQLQLFGWNGEFFLLIVFVDFGQFLFCNSLNCGELRNVIVKEVIFVLDFSKTLIKGGLLSG